MERQELSPHAETILFQLVEIETRLPRQEQSRRFKVKVSGGGRKAVKASIQPAASSKALTLRTDAECFGELVDKGYIEVAEIGYPIPNLVQFVRTLPIMLGLTESAFSYYDEKHDFPTSLADERREFVNSRISTVHPEVVAHLKKAYDAIWVEQPARDWSTVAHDCWAALRSFAGAVYKQEYASGFHEGIPSSDDFGKKLEQVIRANTRDEKLRGLLVKLNAYVHARRHDPGTTRDEAKRCVLLTYVVLAEIWETLASRQD